MRGLRALVLGASFALAGVSCSLDWGRFAPPDDVSAPDIATSVDAAPCGAEDQRCCPETGCSTGLVCNDSRCRACGRDETACANRCVTLSKDERNCGVCGVLCVAGERCVQGRCR